MQDKLKKYLFDIKESVSSIYDYLDNNFNFFEYEKNKLLKRAVERELEIIGEAVNRILKIDPDIKINNSDPEKLYSTIQLKPMLFQAEYLTIKDFDGTLFSLSYPNEDVLAKSEKNLMLNVY
ncbi:MAG: hypothetical protein RBR08_14140 [Desulforegulaceae bacterium]|nr:hypothetical protein [Desulforegulaceae bacterium]